MLKYIRKLFNISELKLPKLPEPKHPNIGEVWHLRNDSPWPKKHSEIRILDVKSGWVKYSMGYFFNDERCEMDQFLYSFRFHGDD